MASRTPSQIALLLMIIMQSWQWLMPRKKPENPKIIWVVHQLLLGDTLMLTGLLAKLRQNYPRAKIIMLGNPHFAELYQSRPYDVQYWGYNPRSLHSFRQLFLLAKPDWAIVPGDNRYGWLAFVCGAKWLIAFTGDRPAHKQWCFNELLPLPNNPIALPDMMQQLCTGKDASPYEPEHWKIANEQILPAFAPPVKANKNNQLLQNKLAAQNSVAGNESPLKIDQTVSNNAVLFHIGAKSAIKHWPTQNWLALASYFKRYNKQVILSAGKGEEAQLDEIQKVTQLSCYRGNLSLLQLTAVMQSVELIVCLDNGIGQLAKVIATPTVCLFGAGSTRLFAEARFWENIPYRSVTTDIECRNTSLLFRRKIDWIKTCNRSITDCVHQSPTCMQNISLQQVIQACEQVMKPSSQNSPSS